MGGPRLFDNTDWKIKKSHPVRRWPIFLLKFGKSKKRSARLHVSSFSLKIMLPVPGLDGRLPKKRKRVFVVQNEAHLFLRGPRLQLA